MTRASAKIFDLHFLVRGPSFLSPPAGVPCRGRFVPWRRGSRCRYAGSRTKPFLPCRAGTFRGFLCPAGRGLFLANVWLLFAMGHGPKPFTPPAGPHFWQQKWGKDCQRGESPLGTPTGKQTAACGCAGPKGGPACATALWLSLIKCLRRIFMAALSIASRLAGWRRPRRAHGFTYRG